MENKVSIIMPIYKVNENLEKSINSVLNQTYSKFELILIVDATLNDYYEICNEYAKNDKRIKVVCVEEDDISFKRNAGINIATGKYACFIDCGDFAEPNLLHTCIKQMDKGYDLFCFRHDKGEDTYYKNKISQAPSFFGEQNFITTQQKLQLLVDVGLEFMSYKVTNKMFKMDIIKDNNIRFETDEIIALGDMFFCLCYVTFCSKIFSDNKKLICSSQKEKFNYNKDFKYGLLNRVNELLKKYYCFLTIYKHKKLLNVFSPLYLEVLEHYTSIFAEINDITITNVQQKRSLLQSNILDWVFYCKQLKKIKKYKNCILKLEQHKYDYLDKFYLKLIEIKYLINGKYSLFKIRRKLFFVFKCKYVNDKNVYVSAKLKVFKKNKQKIYILGIEDYGNIGDHFINVTTSSFLKEKFPGHAIFEVSGREYFNYKTVLKKYIKHNDIIICPGGGNFGNEYYFPDKSRMDIITTWKKNKKIIFPQTLFFTQDQQGEEYLENTKQIYTNENNVVLFTREKYSYEFAKQNYSCKVELVPDIVLINNLSSNLRRTKVLFCLRKDKESVLSQEDKQFIFNLLEKYEFSVEKFDLEIEEDRNLSTRDVEVNTVLNSFFSSKLIITDRLHGMIISAITATPCIALSNYNFKIKGTYEWLKTLPYIKYIDDVSVIEGQIKKMLDLKETSYDNSDLLPYYKLLEKEIKG